MASATRERTGHRNPALLLLVALALLAVSQWGFVSFAPNRLLSGRAIPLWQAADGPGLVAVLAIYAVLAGSGFLRSRRASWTALAAGAAAVLVLILVAGRAASALLAEAASPAARVSLGGAFWMLLFTAALSAVDALQRLSASLALRASVAALLAGGVALILASGAASDLSLMREYLARRDVFAAELERHLGLVAMAVTTAIAVGLPLGLAVRRRPRLGRITLGVLSLLQTVPSIALFGLIIGPLSVLTDALPWLRAAGVRGIGPAPAVIALVLYSLLPIVRNVEAGLGSVPAAVREAAEAMGMRRAEILRHVEIPLAWPVVVAGIRIVTVQAIGLGVVAALIGAGGLGTFVFQGLGQNAIDLVLLGALTTIALALLADFGFRVLGALFGSEGR